MIFAYTNAQTREADRQTMEEGTSSYMLMTRAGRALADEVKKMAGADKEILFVCGGGNNGGDGWIAAELLRQEGFDVSVLCLSEKFSPDCTRAKAEFGGEVFIEPPQRKFPVAVDCVLGTGISRPPEGEAAEAIRFINENGGTVVSADIPSGLSENGIAFIPHVTAEKTVCMGLYKNCLFLCDGADLAGEIALAEIGIKARERGAEIWENGDVANYFPKRKSNVNKGTFGSAGIFAGEPAYSGAAFLAAEACLKSGAGYTRLYAGGEFYRQTIGKLPACVLQKFCAIDGELLSSDAIAVGMGAGVSDRVYAFLDELLQKYTGTLILDADALNALSVYGKEILKNKSCSVILTPHPGEFSRLIGKTVRETLSHAAEYAEAFAREYRVTLVLKNNRTLITDGERKAINKTGSPALAKGGSGDILAGFLTGTCARGVPPFEAACVSSYLLGRAGEIAADELGEYSPDAADVLRRFPQAILSLKG